MHILLTRPLDDCKELIVRFKSLGHKVSHLPVIKIQNVNHDKLNVNEFGGIIFTSANAIKNLNTLNINKQINCFCVGSSTENVAKQNGFQNIFCAEGNVNNLKELILQNFNLSDGKLIYVSGQDVSTNLHLELISEGYNIKRVVNYKANSIEKFDQKFIDKLKLKMPQLVYVYSQNSAVSLLNIIKNYQLDALWMDTNLMCISEKTSTILNEIKWKKIFLFNPGEEEFLLYKI